jgi:NAD(P)-dependent dehydrogenase (short-subunit alcohol dehydrogenase family)
MSPVALVTGASGGVGRATASRFAEEGYDVALVARGRDGLEHAAQEVEARGRKALALPLDVADAQAVEAAAERTEQELGPIDVWVNDAMATVFAKVRDLDPDEVRRVTEVTYLGQVNGTITALRRMLPRDHGVIVSVGSALAFHAIPAQAAYCASKFAVRGFHEALRCELLADGSKVRVAEVHLPAVNTPQFGWGRSKFERHPQPVPPIYQPETIARHIYSAAVKPGRPRIVGSWNRVMVFVGTRFRGVADHYLARTALSDQLASPEVDADPSDDLFEPVDDTKGSARTSRGIFDERANGALDPSFLSSLPTMAANMAAAARERAKEIYSHLEARAS